MSWLSKIFGGGDAAPQYDVFDVTDLNLEERVQKLEEQVNATEIPKYEGRVMTYAYSKSYAMYIDRSPRDENEPLVQKWAFSMVATQSKPRAILAPAYFDEKNYALVVDDNIVKAALSNDYEYQGVMGLYQGNKAIVFGMFEDKEVEYTYDKAKKPLRMREVDLDAKERQEQLKGKPSFKDKKKARQKQRRSRKTRRLNRKK